MIFCLFHVPFSSVNVEYCTFNLAHFSTAPLACYFLLLKTLCELLTEIQAIIDYNLLTLPTLLWHNTRKSNFHVCSVSTFSSQTGIYFLEMSSIFNFGGNTAMYLLGIVYEFGIIVFVFYVEACMAHGTLNPMKHKVCGIGIDLTTGLRNFFWVSICEFREPVFCWTVGS